MVLRVEVNAADGVSIQLLQYLATWCMRSPLLPLTLIALPQPLNCFWASQARGFGLRPFRILSRYAWCVPREHKVPGPGRATGVYRFTINRIMCTTFSLPRIRKVLDREMQL